MATLTLTSSTSYSTPLFSFTPKLPPFASFPRSNRRIIQVSASLRRHSRRRNVLREKLSLKEAQVVPNPSLSELDLDRDVGDDLVELDGGLEGGGEERSDLSNESELWNRLESWVDQYKRDNEVWGVGTGPIFTVYKSSGGKVARVEVSEGEIVRRSRIEARSVDWDGKVGNLGLSSRMLRAKLIAEEIMSGVSEVPKNSSVFKVVVEGEKVSFVEGFNSAVVWGKSLVKYSRPVGLTVLLGYFLVWAVKASLFRDGETEPTSEEKEMLRRKLKARKERDMVVKGSVEVVEDAPEIPMDFDKRPTLDRNKLMENIMSAKSTPPKQLANLGSVGNDSTFEDKVKEIRAMARQARESEKQEGQKYNQKEQNNLNLKNIKPIVNNPTMEPLAPTNTKRNDQEVTRDENGALNTNESNTKESDQVSSEHSSLSKDTYKSAKPLIIRSVKEAREYLSLKGKTPRGKMQSPQDSDNKKPARENDESHGRKASSNGIAVEASEHPTAEASTGDTESMPLPKEVAERSSPVDEEMDVFLNYSDGRLRQMRNINGFGLSLFSRNSHSLSNAREMQSENGQFDNEMSDKTIHEDTNKEESGRSDENIVTDGSSMARVTPDPMLDLNKIEYSAFEKENKDSSSSQSIPNPIEITMERDDTRQPNGCNNDAGVSNSGSSHGSDAADIGIETNMDRDDIKQPSGSKINAVECITSSSHGPDVPDIGIETNMEKDDTKIPNGSTSNAGVCNTSSSDASDATDFRNESDDGQEKTKWLEKNFHKLDKVVEKIGTGFRQNYKIAKEKDIVTKELSELGLMQDDGELEWMNDDKLRDIVFQVRDNELAGHEPFHLMSSDDQDAFFKGLEKKAVKVNEKLLELHEYIHSRVENIDYGADGISVNDPIEKIVPCWKGPSVERIPEFLNNPVDKQETYSQGINGSSTPNDDGGGKLKKSKGQTSNSVHNMKKPKGFSNPRVVIEGSDGSTRVGKKGGKEHWQHTKKWSREFLELYNAETDPEIKSTMKDMGKDLDKWITEKEVQDVADLMTQLPKKKRKFIERKLEKLKREMEMFGPQAVVSKYREYSEEKEEDNLWWLDLEFVLCIELYTVEDDEQRVGFYSLAMAQDLELNPKQYHIIAFEDPGDSKNFCYIMQAHLEMIGKGAAFVVARPPKDAFREAKANGFHVTVIRKGQIKLNVDQTLEEVEEEITEIGSKMYHDEIMRERSVDMGALMKGVFGSGRSTKKRGSKRALKKRAAD